MKKRTVLVTGDSILSGLRGSSMSKWSLVEVPYCLGAMIHDDNDSLRSICQFLEYEIAGSDWNLLGFSGFTLQNTK